LSLSAIFRQSLRFHQILHPWPANTNKKRPIVHPAGKPMILHLLCCQWFAVSYYSFTLGRLESAASSTFETSA
jgi:hypothetical protein